MAPYAALTWVAQPSQSDNSITDNLLDTSYSTQMPEDEYYHLLDECKINYQPVTEDHTLSDTELFQAE